MSTHLSTNMRLPREKSNIGTLKTAITEARKILQQGVENTGPHKGREHNAFEGVFELLGLLEKLVNGEVNREDLPRAISQVFDQYPVLGHPARRPEWLPPEVAALITNAVYDAERHRPGAAEEFQDWFRSEFPKARGRPPSDKLDETYRQAAKMRKNVRPDGRPPSWSQITRQLCPSRRNDHRCTKACEDKIRMGVRDYRRTPR